MIERPISRRSFVAGTAFLAMSAAIGMMSGCSGGSPSSSTEGSSAGQNGSTGEPITMVWLPDNSSADLSGARDAIAAAITAACGRPAEMLTTVDYNVAIESIATGKAHMASLGAEGYIQANKKNPAVQAAFTNSDENGGLDGACYYSRICVLSDNADEYKKGDTYSIDNIEGKSFSFVTPTSTSGFKVPSSVIVKNFGLENSDVLLESGSFFSQALFGNSHQGSAVNLLSGDAEVAAFCDTDTDMYLDLASGEANTVGAVYQVKADAPEPFDGVRGKKFTIIGISPVLNAPVCFNEDVISEDDRKKIVEYFCSDTVANDPQIFVDPDDENAVGIYEKDSADTRFVAVDDAWYEPIRKLGSAS